jgi:hypothetical protein
LIGVRKGTISEQRLLSEKKLDDIGISFEHSLLKPCARLILEAVDLETS